MSRGALLEQVEAEEPRGNQMTQVHLEKWLLNSSSSSSVVVVVVVIHRVSKNVPVVPPSTCYNPDMHGSITIIFGKSVTEKVGNQNVLYFPTSPNLCFCTTWGNRKSKNCVF